MALMVNVMGSMFGGATLVSGALAGFLIWLYRPIEPVE